MLLNAFPRTGLNAVQLNFVTKKEDYMNEARKRLFMSPRRSLILLNTFLRTGLDAVQFNFVTKTEDQMSEARKELFMRVRRILSLALVVSPGLLAAWSQPAASQTKYPARPIDIIVPFAPGAATDATARVTANYLEKKWGTRINVINKPGGNSVPANLEVYNAAPDGYTLMLDSQSSASMLPAAMRELPFKVLDRTFVAIVTASPFIMIVSANSPIKALKEVAEEAKKDPAAFTWGSLGGAGMQDFGTRQFLKAIGVDVTRTKPVIAPGGAPLVTMTAGGLLKVGASTAQGILPAYRSKIVKPLAQTGKTRHPDFPDTPTFEEAGYPSVTCYFWAGISAPPKLPRQIVDAWNKALKEAFADPEFVTRVKKTGGVPFYKDDRETRAYVEAEMKEVSALWGLK